MTRSSLLYIKIIVNNINSNVALITGASSGMGKDFAHALLREGMTVYAAARRVERMADLKEAGAVVMRMDITNEQDMRRVVEQVSSEHGAVQVLINNAGFGLFGAIEDTTMEDARYQFEVNFFGLARLTQLVLPGMRAAHQGRIINISSMGGRVYTPLGGWYHATKHALEGWSDCLRIELKQFGIDVVVVQPGAIATEFGDVMMGSIVERSGSGVYGGMVTAMGRLVEKMGPNSVSPPSVITNLVLQAVRAKRPQTRYVGGRMAKPMMGIRRWFGDRVFDRLLTSMIKTAR